MTALAMLRLVADRLERRQRLSLLGLLAVLLLAPVFLDRYLLSVMILVFWYATVGQAWNIMMGYCGQLSLGHCLYSGLGGYIAALLWVKFGIPPWLAALPAMGVACGCGVVIGWLAFRYEISGVYFALLTIAFAEIARIAFDNWAGGGGAAGFFIPLVPVGEAGLWTLSGGPLQFYYLMLAFALAALILTAALRASPLGHAWLAIREEPEAARALGIDIFRAKLAAIVISAAITALAGVVYAFYQRNLFPSEAFDMSRSIVMIMGPIVGGLGTLMGPVIGALILTPLGQALIALIERLFGHAVPGANLLAYGLLLMVIISTNASGVWPGLSRRLGLAARTGP